MHITTVTAQKWTLPLREPFIIAQRHAVEAQNVLVRISSYDGEFEGVGASAPVQYVTGESIESVITDVERYAEAVAVHPRHSLDSYLDLAHEVLSGKPAARAGVEIALYDLWAKSLSINLLVHFGGRASTLVTDLTLPISDPKVAFDRARAAAHVGYGQLKVKVGSPNGVEDDILMLTAVIKGAPDVKIRIDANQAYNTADAIVFSRRAYEISSNIELIEQPVDKQDVQGLAEVKRSAQLPIFADEAACSIDQVRALIKLNAVDGINVKLMKCGIKMAQEIIEVCQNNNIKLMLGCMLETELGIAAACTLAAGTNAFDYIDLDSHNLLKPVSNIHNACFEQICDKIMVHEHNITGWGISVDQQ